VTGLGVDEHAWRRANRQQRTRFAIGIVDLGQGRSLSLLDVLDDRFAERSPSTVSLRTRWA
jgi:hypothetical protein